MKEHFINLFKENIHREGADALLAWMEKSDFFTAPASTKYHLAREGGLCEHSINVYSRFDCDNPESRAICGLLHDVCKTNYYDVAYRNAKDDNGKWQKVPYYTVEDKLPYGHGEKSVYIISGFMKLTREEAMAIRWHMGGFDDSVKSGSYAMSEAFRQFPVALRLHIADMEATYFDEVEDNSNGRK